MELDGADGHSTQGADSRRTAVHWTDRHPASSQCKVPRHSGRGENPLAGFVLRERANACTSDNALATFRGLPSPAPPDPTGKPRRKLPPTRPRHRWPSGSGWEGDPGQAAQARGTGGGALEGRTPEPSHCGNAVRPCAHSCVYRSTGLRSDTAEGHPAAVGGKTRRDAPLSLSFPSSASRRTWEGAGPRGGQPQAPQPSPSATLPPPASQPLWGFPRDLFSASGNKGANKHRKDTLGHRGPRGTVPLKPSELRASPPCSSRHPMSQPSRQHRRGARSGSHGTEPTCQFWQV